MRAVQHTVCDAQLGAWLCACRSSSTESRKANGAGTMQLKLATDGKLKGKHTTLLLYLLVDAR